MRGNFSSDLRVPQGHLRNDEPEPKDFTAPLGKVAETETLESDLDSRRVPPDSRRITSGTKLDNTPRQLRDLLKRLKSLDGTV